MARKKNVGQKRAKKVRERKKKKQEKARQEHARVLAGIVKLINEADSDGLQISVSVENVMAKALSPEGDVTVDEAAEAEADELFDEAMEAPTTGTCCRLLEAALAKNPRHIDALVELAQLCKDDNTAFYFLSRAIEFGEEDLEDELRNNMGDFWGLLHTRPFMRAKQDISERYYETGDLLNAASEMEEMLQLNSLDNQGMRWTLMEVYCRMDRLDDAEQLLQRYPDDCFPFMQFTALLVRFRKEGDTPELRTSLREQANRNPHIVPRLLDPSLISYEPVALFVPGSPDEADLYCQQFLFVWKSTPGAITWLRQATRDLPSSEVGSDKDVKKKIQKLRAKVKKLDSCTETWFCDAKLLSEQEDDGWLLTVVEESTETVIYLEPGEDPLGADTVLDGLLNSMLAPHDEKPRKPAAIELTDAGLHRSLKKRFERLGIALNVTDERPAVLDFIERSAPVPGLPVQIDINDLRDTLVSSATWEIDWRQIDQWLPDEETGELMQPWMILVADREDLVLSQQLLLTPPDSNTILSVIGEAILNPPGGTPSRPATIWVPSAEHHLDVKPVADDIGVECVVGQCQLIDQMFESLSQHMDEAVGGPPALVSLPNVTPDMVGDFYEAAADFYKSRVWTSTHPESVVEIQCSELIHGRWYAVITGQMGQEIGIILFDDPEALESVFASDPSDLGAGAKQRHGISFSLNEQSFVNPRDVAAAEQFGWSVAGPEAWPMGFFIADSDFRPLTAVELQFLAAATRSVTKQLQSQEKSLMTSVPLYDRIVQVLTSRE
ncbi:tetratricopeptide repeat protein [Gimesia sp.]|uniref:tetratricopeptide repeat protein n=1 Tax=Gimesia sp. TaxID=2024833 RepID=UPI003A8CEC83